MSIMIMARKIIAVFSMVCFVVIWTETVVAYTISTHRILNESAVLASKLDSFLRNNLMISDGVDQKIQGNSIINMIGKAGATEDLNERFFNHFHNPLKPWNQAGLNDTFIHFPVRGKSSLLWGQEAVGVQEWSWRDARSYYYMALTGATQAKRDEGFAKTFRAVGQVMHLVVDASVPAHTRNDAHPTGYHYETWVSSQEGTIIRNPVFPRLDLSMSINNYSPVSHFIDTNRYHDHNPEVTEWEDIGLAEYTNAHFFSNDTIFAGDFSANDRHYFPHPKKDSIDLNPWTDETNNRQYLREFKSAESGGMQHVVAVSYLYWYRRVFSPPMNKYLPVGLDEKVFEDQAERLVPRAIGYSAKLLDYFFRGKLDAEGDAEDGIKIMNSSSEEMIGAFELYYDAIDPESGGESRKLGGGPWLLSLTPGTHSLPQPFIEPSDAKEAGKYWLVFKGKLGSEREAVAGSFIEIKTIPFAFVIQEEVIAPGMLEVDETFTFPYLEEVSNKVWISQLHTIFQPIVPHHQSTHGRFIFYEQPESIKIFGGPGNTFFINGQVMPNGTWHQGDTAMPPQTWKYVETEEIKCRLAGINICLDLASIEIVFKGGQRLEQSLWLYQWVRKSSSIRRESRIYSMFRSVEMFASVGNQSSHRYYGLEPVLQFPGKRFITPLKQFKVLKWPGSEGVESCPPRDFPCKKSGDEIFYWGVNRSMGRNVMLGYRKYKTDIVLTSTPRETHFPLPPPLPHFNLTLAGAVKRIYSPQELLLLGQLGVKPLEYTVTFR